MKISSSDGGSGKKKTTASKGPKSSYGKSFREAKTATLKQYAKVGPSALKGANKQRVAMKKAEDKATAAKRPSVRPRTSSNPRGRGAFTAAVSTYKRSVAARGYRDPSN